MFIDWLAIFSNFTGRDLLNLIIGSFFTGGAFWIILQYITQKTIDLKVTKKVQEHKAELDKQLEAYKTELQNDMKVHEQQLQVLTEEAKYRFNCLSQDYNMYSKERYNSYITIRKKLLDAISYTLGLRGFVQVLDFTKLSKDEVIEWLDRHEFGEYHKNSVLSIWDSYPDSAVERLGELRKIYNEHTATKACDEAHDYILGIELFISDELLPLLQNTKNKVYELLSKYKLAGQIDRRDLPDWVAKEQALAKEIPELFKEVTAQMKAELTYANNIKDKN